MFKHILVPVSQVGEIKHALEIAMDLATGAEGKITLIHVIEQIKDTSLTDFRDFYETLEKHARADLDFVTTQYAYRNIPIDTHIVLGRRVREIVTFAKENNVDLIVLQSHPIDLDDPTRGWGTISYRVAVLAQCPVMLVK